MFRRRRNDWNTSGSAGHQNSYLQSPAWPRGDAGGHTGPPLRNAGGVGFSVGADLRVGLVPAPRRRGRRPFHAAWVETCRPGKTVREWWTGGHIGPPLQGHASHSDLCCSHHAGNAGSFGERVGVIVLLTVVVSFCVLLKGATNPKTLLLPKYNNSRTAFLPCAQIVFIYVFLKSSKDCRIVSLGDICIDFNWPYKYRMFFSFFRNASLSRAITISSLSVYPRSVVNRAVLTTSFVSSSFKHRLKMAWTLASLSSKAAYFFSECCILLLPTTQAPCRTRTALNLFPFIIQYLPAHCKAGGTVFPALSFERGRSAVTVDFFSQSGYNKCSVYNCAEERRDHREKDGDYGTG